MNELLSVIDEKKNKLDAHKPLVPALAKNLFEWTRVELTYHSNALEGNTLTCGETAQILEKGLTIGGKSFIEHLEAINHAKAFDFIAAYAAQHTRAQFTVDTLYTLHKLILAGIDDQNAGIARSVAVRISGSRVPRPNYLKVPELLEAFVKTVTTSSDHPVHIAANAHLDFVFIHPFVDGNGRTARLLMNMILLQAGYPVTIIETSQRMDYINSIEKALLSDKRDDFYTLMYHSVIQALDRELESIAESIT